MSRKVAFVTGASRGIGKGIAIELAEAGFDVAILARTVQEGEEREHSSTLKQSDTSAMPGSLDTTAAACRAAGAQVLSVKGDLLDPASLGAAITTVIERWGGVDVLVNNGQYVGPGHMDRFLDTPIEYIRRFIDGDLIAALVLSQLALPSMIARGGGTIVNISSGSAYSRPLKGAGEGGWSLGYAVAKGGAHRIAGMLKAELGDSNIRCFNVNPGWVVTERVEQDMAKFGFDLSNGARPVIPAKVVRWLCTSTEAQAYNGENIEAQEFCEARGLYPGWKKPEQGAAETAIRDYVGLMA